MSVLECVIFYIILFVVGAITIYIKKYTPVYQSICTAVKVFILPDKTVFVFR